MRIDISEEPLTNLEEYATVPISFQVRLILDVAAPDSDSGEFILTERPVDVPYLKDYDSAGDDNPVAWAGRYDISNWGLFAARAEGRRLGGVAIAFKTPDLDMLEGREDLAVLWDIRVSPEARGKGIGSELFRAAESWARAKGCRQLKVETQNINVSACRFYARQGCVLKEVHRHAYRDLPDEIQFLWYKDLGDGA